jgi:hypothetical protein
MKSSHPVPHRRIPASIVWKGAILGTIVKSIATAIHADFDSLQSWSENNYVVQGWDGRYGAVSFAGPQGDFFHPERSLVVGAFYSAKSNRGPTTGQGQRNREPFFVGCPAPQRQLAYARALQFLLFDIHPGGPCVTSAFWNDGAFVTAADPWPVILENGADLIQNEMVEDVEEALIQWQEEFGLSVEQIALAWSIYQRRMKAPHEVVNLSVAERSFLASLSEEPDAIPACRRSFADIGVVVP